jgi:pyridinium-3,5-biscarboxylic acid mononucleotide synthase
VNEEQLKEMLDEFRLGKLDLQTVINRIKNLPYEDIGYAKVDNHRELRNGFPEVIFCQGKTNEQIKGIAEKMTENGSNILATKAGNNVFEFLKQSILHCEYYPEAKIIFVKNHDVVAGKNKILVVTGGTSDIPVAEEAAVTAEKFGNTVERLFDVGVAGIHRLFNNRQKLYEASVIIVVAGMEGALPSVIGGLVDKPVIAVPTSVGYGTNFGGLTALFTMLNSCSSGIGVVNIDNGFGAGYLAATILKQIEKN